MIDIITNHPLLSPILLCLIIFCARILDVSIGTIRIIFVSKGFKWMAPTLSFFEVLLWLLAITQIIKNIDHFYYYLAYAGGFAVGTYVGIIIENRIAMGVAIIRIILPSVPQSLVEHLTANRQGITTIDAQGLFGPVKILFMILKRKHIKSVLAILKEDAPDAVYTIEDVRSVCPKALPSLQPDYKKVEHHLFKIGRKGK